MVIKGLFFHCAHCKAFFDETGVNPQAHVHCRCIYLPFNFS